MLHKRPSAMNSIYSGQLQFSYMDLDEIFWTSPTPMNK